MTLLAGTDPVAGIGHMLAQPFLARAFVAGGLIAVAAGLVGYFLVLRSQVFTGDALSHVAFTGALGALAVGIDLRAGLFGACVAFALAMAALGRKGRADDVVIGSVFAWVLGLGVLFLTIYTTSSRAGGGDTGPNVLFGSIFGLTAGQSVVAASIALGVVAAIVTMARPLLFASIDPAVAAAHGVPVTALGLAFLALVGITAGEATQAVGALLLLGLLAAPAGAAQRLTTNPWTALTLAGGIALGSMWAGLCLSYAASGLPPSFSIIAMATASYFGARTVSVLRRRSQRLGLELGGPGS